MGYSIRIILKLFAIIFILISMLAFCACTPSVPMEYADADMYTIEVQYDQYENVISRTIY